MGRAPCCSEYGPWTSSSGRPAGLCSVRLAPDMVSQSVPLCQSQASLMSVDVQLEKYGPPWTRPAEPVTGSQLPPAQLRLRWGLSILRVGSETPALASSYLESTCWLGAHRFSYTADSSAGRCSCGLKPQHFPVVPGNPFIRGKPACTGSLGPLGLGVLGLHQAVGYPAAEPLVSGCQNRLPAGSHCRTLLSEVWGVAKTLQHSQGPWPTARIHFLWPLLLHPPSQAVYTVIYWVEQDSGSEGP